MTLYLERLVARLSGRPAGQPLRPFIRSYAGPVVDPFIESAPPLPPEVPPAVRSSRPALAGPPPDRQRAGESPGEVRAGPRPPAATGDRAPQARQGVASLGPTARPLPVGPPAGGDSARGAAQPPMAPRAGPLPGERSLPAPPGAPHADGTRSLGDLEQEVEALTRPGPVLQAEPQIGPGRRRPARVPAPFGPEDELARPGESVPTVEPDSRAPAPIPTAERPVSEMHALRPERGRLRTPLAPPAGPEVQPLEHAVPELRPPAPPPFPIGGRAEEGPRIVIGQLRVEVTPAPPDVPQPARPAPRGATSPDRAESPRSMLRFGLGQM